MIVLGTSCSHEEERMTRMRPNPIHNTPSLYILTILIFCGYLHRPILIHHHIYPVTLSLWASR